MKFFPLILLVALAACGTQPASETESAEDYAARLGTSGSAAEGAAAPGAGQEVAVAPPANSEPLQLERLGDIRSVDLGMRAGGCTFSSDGNALLTAVAPADRGLPGKATVRIGGQLVLLDAEPGGFAGLKDGATFTGEGVTADLARGRGDAARLTLTDAGNETRTIEGRWACS